MSTNKTIKHLQAMLFLLCTIISANISANEIHAEAANFTLRSNASKNIKLSELRGQVVLINFWSSMYDSCRQQMPELNKLYLEHKASGFTVLGINIEENTTAALKIISDDKINFPILFDAENRVSQLYNITAIPTSVLISRDGTVRYLHQGYKPDDISNYKKWIEQLIRK